MNPADLNSGDTSWVLFCTAAVLFMTPGLALFYAGMVSRRNTLVMLQQNFIPLGVISLTWVLVGYSLAFGTDTGNGLIADLQLFGLQDLGQAPPPALHKVSTDVAIPTLAFVAYQMMFAVITPALATGAVASRLKPFGLGRLPRGVVDHRVPPDRALALGAGRVADHPRSPGLGRRHGGPRLRGRSGAGPARRARPPTRLARPAPLPHSVPFVIVGAGILWFGWFGFNAGDGLQANGVAAQALVNTQVAAAAAMLVWLVVERITDGHASVLGAVTGAVAGLATITPAAGYVSTLSAVAIGALAGGVCHLALRLKVVFRYDDALDVIAVHFVGGLLGSLLVGFFGEASINSIGADGVFFGGGFGLLASRFLPWRSVIAFSFVATWLIATAIERTIGLRAAPEDEGHLDEVQQGMNAYDSDAIGVATSALALTGTTAGTVVVGGPDLRLVSAVLDADAMDGPVLADSLLDAGAQRVLSSDAHAFSARSQPQVVRGERRERQATPLTRLEILVGREQVAAVTEVLRARTGGPVHVVVQVVADDPGSG